MSELLERVIVEIVGDDSKLQRALDRAERNVEGAADRMEAAWNRAVGPSTRLLKITGALSGALGALGLKAVAMAGDMEQARIGLTTMLGSAEAADKHLRQLYDFAAKTPFEINGLIDADRRLMAMGFSADEVIPSLTAIGDAVAAVGGSAELLDRVTLALGQMRAKGKVSAEEMRQLAEAGIPAWEMLADKIGTDIPTAMKLAEQGAIDATTGINAVLSGMEERFGGAMEAQSRTIMGMWSNIKDNLTRIMVSLGEQITDALDVREILQISLDALERFRGWLEQGGLQKWWSDYHDVIVIVGGAVTGALVPAVAALTAALWGAIAPLAPFIAAGAALAGAFILLGGTMDDVKVALKTLGVLFSGLWDIFAGFVQGTIGKLKALDDAWRAYVSGVSVGISNMGRAIDAVIHGRFREAMEWAQGAVDAWKGGLSAAWGEIADAGQEGADRIYQGLVKISDVVTGQVGAAYAEAKAKAEEATEAAATGFGVKVPQAAKKAGDSINTNINEPLKTATEQAEKLVKVLGDGMYGGSFNTYSHLGARGGIVAPRGEPPTVGGARLDYGLADFDEAAKEAAQSAEEFAEAQREAIKKTAEMYSKAAYSLLYAGMNRLGLTPPPPEPTYNTISGTGSSDYGASHEPGLGRRGAVVAPREGPDIAGGARLDYNLANFDIEDRWRASITNPTTNYDLDAREAGTKAEAAQKAKQLTEWLGKMTGSVKSVLNALNPFAAILDAINPIGTIIQGMLEELAPVLEPITKVFADIGRLLGKIISPILKALTPILQALYPAFRALGTIIAWLWNGIATVVNKLFGWAGANLDYINLDDTTDTTTTGSTTLPEPTDWGTDITNQVDTIGISAAPTPVVATPGWVATFGGHVDRFGAYVTRLVEEGIRITLEGGVATTAGVGIMDRTVAGGV